MSRRSRTDESSAPNAPRRQLARGRENRAALDAADTTASTDTRGSWLTAVRDLCFDLFSWAPDLGSFLGLLVVGLAASVLGKLGWRGLRHRQPRRSWALWQREDHDRPG